jgi:AmiR/NasT family two-component response regulator
VKSGNSFQLAYASQVTLTQRETVLAQASGMVSVQAGCSTAEALHLIRQHARSTGRSVKEVAESIVGRHLRIEARS